MKNKQYRMKNSNLKSNITLAALLALPFASHAYAFCDETSSFLDRACKTVKDTWGQGENSIYVPLHAYHLRSAYDKEKIDSFNENTYGIGYGRTRYDEKKNQDEVYAMAFHESHSKPEYIVGYAHQWILGAPTELHAGLGYTAFLTTRTDVMHYTPIPGINVVLMLTLL